MTWLSIVVICWPLVIGISGHDVVLDFMFVVNGTWSNRADVEAGSDQNEVIEVKYVTVDIPALYPHRALFAESSVNGTANNSKLGTVHEDEKSHRILHVRTYSFRNTTKYRPGEIKLDHLYNLTLDEIEDDCSGSYVSVGNGIYSGMSQICNSTNEKDAVYSTLFTCEHFVASGLQIIDETRPSHGIFQRTGPRYPPSNRQDDFVNPCESRMKETSHVHPV
ncbi:unnamed protein product [Candidula unifasciata]|uniref:Uncharacterized protein n=1 Tax=Candidula unifasciata TaxID=100452 RepID=A0A8S3ZRN0_9EUPU|nr:unnamed protein product [Candidula unifasciata]